MKQRRFRSKFSPRALSFTRPARPSARTRVFFLPFWTIRVRGSSSTFLPEVCVVHLPGEQTKLSRVPYTPRSVFLTEKTARKYIIRIERKCNAQKTTGVIIAFLSRYYGRASYIAYSVTIICTVDFAFFRTSISHDSRLPVRNNIQVCCRSIIESQ